MKVKNGYWLLWIVFICTAQMPVSREYQVKAVFLYNFTQFVKWPDQSFMDDKTPVIIGILGHDSFGQFLDQAIDGEQVGSHPLQVKRYTHVSQVSGCHVLFISADAVARQDLEYSSLAQQNILIVGDSNDFIDRGGMVRFFIQDDKIRMQINLSIVEGTDLKISSKLLGLAEIVSTKSDL